MTRERGWLWIALFLGLAVCSVVDGPAARPAAAAGAEPPSQTSDYRLAVLVGGLPEGYAWRYEMPADFDLYYGERPGSHSGVGAYFGAHPNFPLVQSEQATPGVVASRAVRWVIGDGKAGEEHPYWRECRFIYRAVTKQTRLAVIAHVWVYATTQDDLDQLLKSLKDLRIEPPASLVGGAVPARSVTLAPEEAQWARRAWAVCCAYGYGAKADQESAERAAIASGTREAAAGLERLLKALPPSDVRRFAAAFTMALLDLGYEDGRKVLLDYVGMTPKRALRYNSLLGQIGDPGAPEGEQELPIGGLPGYLHALYERRQDPAVLGALLDLVEQQDEANPIALDSFIALDSVLGDLAQQRPRALLAGLRGKPSTVWEWTGACLASSDRYDQIARIAETGNDPLHEAAQRLLAEVRAQQRRQEGGGAAGGQ
jgi:hypothetical protein